MQLSAIPTKLVDIASFPLKDGKTRRVFILIDGKRSLNQIFDLLKIEIQDGLGLVGMMLEKGYLRLLNESSKTSQSSPAGQVSGGNISKSMSTRFLSEVSGELAKFVGPVASIIMEDFDQDDTEIDRETCKNIIATVAKEIDDLDDKMVFLESVQDIITNHS